jgi:LCP family protein required for cell wall assembly
LQATPVPWNGTDRVTVLLMGLDYRDWETGQGAPRTDSMMLVTLDPVTRTGGMLSIPRDLWVEIPGFEHNRINTAYFLGETYNYPGDATHPGRGPGLAMRTVENLLGVPIQYYALIEFAAFERMIDEIGGVHVLVPEPMRIHPIGGPGMALEVKAYHFDGAQALAYARARSTGSGDFDRSSRQQQVVMAVRDRVLELDAIPTLLMRAPALYQEIAAGIHTNLSLDQMVGLGLLAAQIPQENIRRGVIGPPEMVNFETLPDGAQVLRPLTDQIRLLRDEIFTVGGAVGPSIPVEEPVAAANQEGSRVAVRNGAGIEGLATRAADYLRGQGLNVVEVGNADRMDYTTTVIIDYTGNPYTARFLMSLLNLSQSQVFVQTVPDSPVDLAVIVGPDLVVP